MSQRNVIRRPLRKVSIGDMRTPVIVQKASLNAATSGFDATRSFSPLSYPWLCSMKTVHGVLIFSDSNVEEVVTHELIGRTISPISIDYVILHEDTIYRVLTVEDFEERHEYIRVLCTTRGDASLQVNQA